jgi:uncharacterized NAD(P)/FAD-binding protein YdhS
VLGLLRLIRSQVEAAADKGINWRAVIDSLRPVTQDIWRSLPIEEQRRFLRHARSYWDVHRHRVAPEIADLLDDMRSDGLVRLHRVTLLMILLHFLTNNHGVKPWFGILVSIL